MKVIDVDLMLDWDMDYVFFDVFIQLIDVDFDFLEYGCCFFLSFFVIKIVD